MNPDPKVELITKRALEIFREHMRRAGFTPPFPVIEGEAMSLITSTSPKAFSSNVKAEVKAGKSVKQSVAIAYSKKREAEANRKK